MYFVERRSIRRAMLGSIDMVKRGAIIAPLTALVLLSTTRPGHSAERSEFLVKAGVMEAATAGTDRLRETRVVTMDPSRRPGWCFLVDPPSREQYEVYSIHHLPGTPKTLAGDFSGMKPELAVAGIKTAVARVDGIRPFCFDFHSGDPLGQYQVEVFIDGALTTTLRLDVIAPPRTIGGSHD